MESVWSVSTLATESVGSRRELVANCVHTADADATKQFRRCVLGITLFVMSRKALESVSHEIRHRCSAKPSYRIPFKS